VVHDRPPKQDQAARAARAKQDQAAGAARALALVARFFVCVLAAGLLAVPLALERALESTEVHDVIGFVPATMDLTGSGKSEIRLGLLGNVYLPFSRGGIGIVATADGAPSVGGASGAGDLATFFSSRVLEVYTGLFHDPSEAVNGYARRLEAELRREILRAEAGYALVGGSALFAVSLTLVPTGRWHRHRRRAFAIALPVTVVLATTVALVRFEQWKDPPAQQETLYDLRILDGTPAKGTVTDSAVLRLAVEDAIPRVETLIDRQEERTSSYLATASTQLDGDADAMEGPRQGEVAIMTQSDMHCNTTMTALQRQVVRMLDQRYGAMSISLLAISGDLTTNGTAAESACVEGEASVAGPAPVVAVTGNRDSDATAEQMARAGMEVLDGTTVEEAGISVLGVGDPQRTEMFGPTHLRGTAIEASVGRSVYATATSDRPDVVMLHEGYAVESFVGVQDMRPFLDGRGSPTAYQEDGVRDLPAVVVLYGHWHRDVAPRVVWNSDGSWTLVMELNTSGGAIATPTINHFSTPWSTPQQTASFNVVFENSRNRLVTGYQTYRFDVDGTVTVLPRVDVGSPDGKPFRVKGGG